ncbi:hypothetical protein GCM10023238_23410 [Streptomyces heliomycini]
MHIATVNPANGETVKDVPPHGRGGDRAPDPARGGHVPYVPDDDLRRARPPDARAAEILDEDRETIGRVITTEMGKPIAQARAEAAKCAKAMHWYADHAAELLADEEPDAFDVKDSGASGSWCATGRWGPVLAVMPWNFPLWQVVRFAAPALMAGNVGLLKHASNVPQTALYLEDLFHRAGSPRAASRPCSSAPPRSTTSCGTSG